MKVIVIPDVHLKSSIIYECMELLLSKRVAQRIVCLMDLADDFGRYLDRDAYQETYDAAIELAERFPDTLFCIGNHDFSYLYDLPASGFSTAAVSCVKLSLIKLMNVSNNVRICHRVDNIIFSHAGIKESWVKKHIDLDETDSTDDVLNFINNLPEMAFWADDSPIWYRPQLSNNPKMFKEDEGYIHVVGHTRVPRIKKEGSVISTDVFSTKKDGTFPDNSIREYLVIDSITGDFECIESKY